MNKTKNYLLFWFGQAVSQLGSAMTGYALIIWAYDQTHSAMSVSLMSFCSFLPYVLVSLLAGGVVDKVSKKVILIASDSVAAAGTVGVLVCIHQGCFGIGEIYAVNLLVGFMNAFQSPAAAVVTGMLVPEGKYEKASGLNSFSTNLVTVAAPMLSGMLMAGAGLFSVLLFDLATFAFAMASICLVKIPEEVEKKKQEKHRPLHGFHEGMRFLKAHKGILQIMLSMALLNFFSRLTYENILSPMLLARSGGDTTVFGLVNGILGAGGIAGGLLVVLKKKTVNPVIMIYASAALSFLGGDLCMGIGRHAGVWCVAGLAASIPIPFIMAGQNVILYEKVPRDIQGRVFAVRNAVQYSTIPVGILLGGVLADYVFEPFMASGQGLAAVLGRIVGTGEGSGMAVMFLCTGLLGFLSSVTAYFNKDVQQLKQQQ